MGTIMILNACEAGNFSRAIVSRTGCADITFVIKRAGNCASYAGYDNADNDAFFNRRSQVSSSQHLQAFKL